MKNMKLKIGHLESDHKLHVVNPRCQCGYLDTWIDDPAEVTGNKKREEKVNEQ